jgi:choice-of-anchor A domain-containing protein
MKAGANWASQNGKPDVCGLNAWTQGPIAGTQVKYPRDFNLFTLQDATAFPDVQGPAAVGGQFTASSFDLDFMHYVDVGPIGLVAAGSAVLQNGTIYGSVYSPNLATFSFAPLTTLPNSVTIAQGASYASQPISFATAFGNLQTMSQTLKSFPNNPPVIIGTVSFPSVHISGSELGIFMTDSDLNVATIEAAQLIGISVINISIPGTSTLIINVTGGGGAPYPNFYQMQINKPAAVSYNNILWNFPDAAEIDMAAVQFPGSILAPSANIVFKWGGNIQGTLVAKSAGPQPNNPSFELHWSPFRSNWLVQ